MKHFKRLNVYKASNVEFIPETCRAYSYDWWRFVDKVDGLVIFNNHRYSPSTGGHQRKVRQLLDRLGIEIDLFVDTRSSLSASDWIERAIATYSQKSDSLIEQTMVKGTRKAKNEERRAMAALWIERADELRALQRRLEQKVA